MLFATNASGQAIADFTASDTAICAPGLVSFTNTGTTGPGYTYAWDLGNGITSSGKDAATSYPVAGTYTVTLVTTLSSVSSVKKVIVRAYDKPIIDFSASPINSCVKAPITFTSIPISSGAWGGINYTWNFGDGNSSTAAVATYSYLVPGYYNITLFARNMVGCVSSKSKGTYIRVYTPVNINFSAVAGSFCSAPAIASFKNTTTGTPTIAYKWSFGDGSTSNATTPAHTYTAVGKYDVQLTTTDGYGCMDSFKQADHVVIKDLKAGFSVNTNGCPGVKMTFIDTSTMSHSSKTWNFDDGHNSILDTGYNIYTTQGTYNAKLIISDGQCVDSIAHPVTITSPTGNFSIFQPCTPLDTKTYTATVAPSTSVSWNFEKYQTGPTTGSPISHHFQQPISDVMMIMQDTFGCIDTVTHTDTINNLTLDIHESIISGSVSNILEGCVPLSIDFKMLARSKITVPGTRPEVIFVMPYDHVISTYSWDFGDGSPITSASTPTHIYTTVGVYTVTCHVITANGCVADSTIIVKAGSRPTATFTIDRTRVCTGVPITYTSTTNGPPIDRYEWSYGDGKSYKVDTPLGIVVSHISHSPGILHPTLVISHNGCRSLPFQLTDTIDAPNSVISYKLDCIPSNSVSFGDSSIGSDDVLWDFGDGTTSTLHNSVHLFPSLSTYFITLKTHNATTGCRDASTAGINLQRLQISLAAKDAILCKNDKTTIYDTAINTFLLSDPFTLSVKTKWYLNGIFTDSTKPMMPFIPPISSVDSINYNILTRGNNFVTQISTNNHGCFDTATVKIVAAKPIANFTKTITNGCYPAGSLLTDASTDVPGMPLKEYYWSFGDGATATINTSTISHNYATTATYTVTEIAVDTLGCRDTFTANVTATIHAPISDFAVSSVTTCFHYNTNFINNSTASTSWLWMFGDGTTSTVQYATHIYSAVGTYSVTLVAYDAFGCSDTFTRDAYVIINPLPAASFHMDDSFAICPPLNVNFFNNSNGATSFIWSLGDGTFSSTANPNAIYNISGSFRIKLISINDYGCIDTAIGYANVFGYPGGFNYTPTTVCKGDTVHFRAAVSGVDQIAWDYNDGTIGFNLYDTTHVYTSTGKYVPKLFLQDSTGCSNTNIGIDTIKVDTLIPDFTFIPAIGCQNSSVLFSDASHSYFSIPAQWLWTFGPGVTSTGNTPAYTYTVAGIQTVSLTVTNIAGCSSSISKNITINPAPGAIQGNLSVCKGLTTTLTDTTVGGTWSCANTNIASVTAGVVTGNNIGTTIITYTLSTGCNITATITVNIVPLAITGIPNVCIGTTTKLTDATAGGTWTSSNTSLATIDVSGLVSGIVAGTLTISYTTPSGCLALRAITVNPLPAVITGNTQVCRGQTTTLSDANTGGTWTSNNGSVVTIDPVTGLANGITRGTATITYTLSTGCITSTTVTVNQVPTAIVGVTSLCNGDIKTLSNAVAGGTWSSSNTNIIAIDATTGSAAASLAGTSTISYTLTATGCAISRIVTVDPLPAGINGPAAVCMGSAVTLSNITTGGTWSSSNTSIAVISNTGIVGGVNAGTAIISYVLGRNSCLVTMSLSVHPSPAAITGIKNVCIGLSNTLSDATTGGTWSSSNTLVATINSTTGNYTGMLTGTATITYTASGTGCTAMETITVQVTPAAITGASGVCQGHVLSLSNSVAGGLWSTTATVISIDAATGVTNAISAGMAIVTYDINNCIATKAVTVYTLPSTISGVNQICEGNTTTLNNADAGGVWNTINTSIAAIGSGSGIVSAISSGTAVITYTLPTGCSAVITITVDPLPAAISGSSSVCVNGTTLLSNATPGGSWSSGNTTIALITPSSGMLSGVAAGTSTITYTSAKGCIATRQATVEPLPAAITGTDAICTGLTSTLSNADIGGTWRSSNNSIATVTSTTGITTGIAPGTATITYTLPTGCAADIAVTVHPLPAAISVPSNVCPGMEIVATCTDAGGIWTCANTSVAMVHPSTGVITGISAGSATITYMLSTGCINTATITVDPLPAGITGIIAVCAGDTTTLSDASPGGTWSSSSTNINIIPGTGDIAGIIAGTVTITYIIPTGCMAFTTVTVYPLPATISGNTSVCLGRTSVFSDATTGGLWTTSATIIRIGITTGICLGRALGSATITYTLPTGCSINTLVHISDTPSVIKGVKRICIGETTTLSNALTGGSWTSNDMAIAIADASGIVTGISAGTVAISYTSSFGCSAYTTVTVNPSITPISGASTMCNGTSVTLSNATAGGTWSSSNTAIATISETGLLTATDTGHTDITYKVKDVCGEVIAHIMIEPQPGAGIIKGRTNLCIGVPVQLRDSVKGGRWNSSDTSVAKIDAEGYIVGIITGSAIVTYTYTNSCGSARTSVTVSISALPEAVHITTLPGHTACSKTHYQNFGTNVPPATGVNYIWQSTNADIYATGKNKQYCLVSFETAGTSVVRLFVNRPNTECMSYDSVVVNVGDIESQQHEIVYYAPELVCTDNKADSYQWGYDDRYSLDSALLPGINQNYNEPYPDVTNKHYWVITDHKGCLQKSYYNKPTAIGNVANNGGIDILLFPNPAHDIINMQVKGISTGNRTEAKLFDIMGKERKTITLTNGKASMQTTGLTPGIYMIRFTNNGFDIGAKTFVKE